MQILLFVVYSMLKILGNTFKKIYNNSIIKMWQVLTSFLCKHTLHYIAAIKVRTIFTMFLT